MRRFATALLSAPIHAYRYLVSPLIRYGQESLRER